MSPAGWLLIIAGVWLIAQILRGKLLERIGAV